MYAEMSLNCEIRYNIINKLEIIGFIFSQRKIYFRL